MHVGITKLWKTRCGIYPIGVGDWLPWFLVVQYKIATEPYQKMLGNANQYMGFVQCQIWNWQTWEPYSNVQRDEENFRSTNNVENEFWICYGYIKCHVSG